MSDCDLVFAITNVLVGTAFGYVWYQIGKQNGWSKGFDDGAEFNAKEEQKKKKLLNRLNGVDG